jgi:hypothetical protein
MQLVETYNLQHPSIMICFFPFFTILLTIVFVAFATCILLFYPSSCYADKCDAEGVDSSVIFWSTDFFVGISAVVLALHLKCTTRKGLVAGITFLLVALGYFLKAFAAIYFGNSGLDDGYGEMWFYVMTTFYYIFWAFSSCLLYTYFLQAWHLLAPDEKPCGSWQGLIFLVLVVLSTVVILGATVVHSIFSPNSVVKDTTETYQDEGDNTAVCLRVVAIARVVFSGCYSFFLICGASIFGGLTRKDDVIVWGLPISFAAGGIVISQVVAIGVTVFYGLQFLDADGQWEFQDESRAIVNLVFSYVMMMTYFFLHNLVFVLLPEKGSNKNLADTDEDSDSQRESSTNADENEKIFSGGSKNVMLVVASSSDRSEYDDDAQEESRTQSTSYYENASSFPTYSFCSTSFDTRTALTDLRTVESSRQGNIFEHFFRVSIRKTPNDEYSTASVRGTSQPTDDEDNDRSIASHDTKLIQESPSEMTVKVLTQDSTAKEDNFRALSEHTKTHELPDSASKAEKKVIGEVKHHVHPGGCKSMKSEFETLEHAKKLDNGDLRVYSTSLGESREVDLELSQGSTTGGSPNLLNRCRKNTEMPLDVFPVAEEMNAEETRKNKDISCTVRSRSTMYQSLRRLIFSKSEDDRSEDGAVTRSTAPCEASIWNGHKEACEVSLGGDRDVQPVPPFPSKTESRRSKKNAGLSFVGNMKYPRHDFKIPKKPRNDPGFEIIYDEFVAE